MDRNMTPQQVCDELLPGLTPAGLAQMRFRGDGPPFRKPTPRKVLYVESEVREWLDTTKRTSTADKALAS